MDPDAVSVELASYQGLLWAVPVSIGPEQSIFLLDTGAGITTVDVALADRLGIVSTARFSGRRMTGEIVEIGLAEGLGVSIGGVAIAHDTIGVFPLVSLLPDDWPPPGGAIGLPTFAGRPVTIDLARRRLEFPDPPGLSARAKASAPLSIRPAPDGPALDLFVEVRAADRSLWFELDTGNAGPAVVAQTVAGALGLDPEVQDVQEVRLELVGPGPVVTQAVVKPIIHDGVLGLGYLADRALTLDLPTSRAWLS
jgi:hypothetical protein